MAGLLDEVRAVTEQLEPERARACRTAIILARTGVDEIRLRAHARPLGRARTVRRMCPRPLG